MAWQNPKARDAYGDLLGLPREATPAQRGHATGHVTSWPVTNVGEELRHGTSWNFVAMRAIGYQWAGCEMKVYDRSEEVQKAGYVHKAFDGAPEQRKDIPNHPIAKLLRKPNPFRSKPSFFYQVACHLTLTGGFAIWEVRNRAGQPVELWPIPRAFMSYQRASEAFPLGLWRITPPRGMTGYAGPLAAGFYLDARELIMDGWPDPLYPGEFHSPLSACSKIIDIMEKTDAATYSALVNSVLPSMILSLDASVHVDEATLTQMQAKVTEFHAGEENRRRLMLLQGVKPEPVGSTPSELESTQMRQLNKDFGLNVHGVPGLVIGDIDGATYGGNSAAVRAWTELNIRPGLELFAGALSSRFQRYHGTDFEIEFNPRGFDDPQLDLERASALAQGMSPQARSCVRLNEWRAAHKLPPVPGGDELMPMQQPGMVGADGQPVAGAAPPVDVPQDTGEFDLSPELDGEGNVPDETFDLEPALVEDSLPRFSLNGRH